MTCVPTALALVFLALVAQHAAAVPSTGLSEGQLQDRECRGGLGAFAAACMMPQQDRRTPGAVWAEPSQEFLAIAAQWLQVVLVRRPPRLPPKCYSAGPRCRRRPDGPEGRGGQ